MEFINESEYESTNSLVEKKEASKMIHIEGVKSHMIHRDYEDTNQKTSSVLIVQNDEVKYVCQLTPKSMKCESGVVISPDHLIKSPQNMSQILRILFEGKDDPQKPGPTCLKCGDVSNDIHHEFVLSHNGSSLPPTKSVTSENRSKRRKVSERSIFGLCDISLILKITYTPKFLQPYLLCFFFHTVPLIPVGILPNEIFIVIFRYLDSRFLFKSVSFVNRRFHQLIESEYMYQHHHFRLLLLGLFTFNEEPKDQNLSWKEHSKIIFKNRCRWMFLPGDIRRGDDALNIEPKFTSDRRITLKANDKIPNGCHFIYFVCLSPEINPRNSYYWKIRFTTEDTLFTLGFNSKQYKFGHRVGSSRDKVDSYSISLCNGIVHSGNADVGIIEEVECERKGELGKVRAGKEQAVEVWLKNGNVKVEFEGCILSFDMKNEHLGTVFHFVMDAASILEYVYEVVSFKQLK